MTWQAHPREVGNDVAPTSLDEGRGRAVVSVLVVMFNQGLKRRLVGGWMGPWWWYEQKGERAAKCGNVPNAEEADVCHFGKGRETEFPVACSSAASRKAGRAESKPYRQVKVGTVSNVIYQRYM